MSYQVLARKWRPRQFSQLVGQSHVVRVLENSLAEGRVHHAFLFTGTRGVGKTTIARILAKSLNCLEGVSSQPCGECEHCVAIDEGRFVDLLEIDAASRTKVDDTREILDNVQYAPGSGRYKVYLIDEVHMLSRHSFNALLKTLEEPPDHVKFVLATTDPQQIPVTILSRCLQFNLRRLGVEEIAQQLRRILEAEEVEAEPAAVDLLARAADGSMRDGLSLLDQALAAESGLQEASVREMLGSVEQRHVHAILEALAEGEPQAAIAAVAEVFSQARDLGRLLDDLAEALHRIALLQQLPDYRDDSRADWEELVALAGRLAPEDVQLYYQIAVSGRRDLPLAPSARSGCEMTLLRMFAFRPLDENEMPTDRSGDADAPAADPQAASAVAGRDDAMVGEAGAPPAADAPDVGTSWQTADPPRADNWARILAELPLSDSFRSIAAFLVLEQTRPPRIVFRTPREDLVLMTGSFRAALEQALGEYCGGAVQITIEAADGETLATPDSLEQSRAENDQARAAAAIADDPLLQRLVSRFDAEVVPESIRPLNTRSH